MNEYQRARVLSVLHPLAAALVFLALSAVCTWLVVLVLELPPTTDRTAQRWLGGWFMLLLAISVVFAIGLIIRAWQKAVLPRMVPASAYKAQLVKRGRSRWRPNDPLGRK